MGAVVDEEWVHSADCSGSSVTTNSDVAIMVNAKATKSPAKLNSMGSVMVLQNVANEAPPRTVQSKRPCGFASAASAGTLGPVADRRHPLRLSGDSRRRRCATHRGW